MVSTGAAHFYISQTDKGEVLLGGELDGYNSYSQRGTLPSVEHVVAAATEMFPCIGRLRFMRQWAGVMDMSMDGSPIIGKAAGGWALYERRLVLRRLQGHARLRLVPGLHTMAQDDAPHALNAGQLTLGRFRTGSMPSMRRAPALIPKRIREETDAMMLIPCPWCRAPAPETEFVVSARTPPVTRPCRPPQLASDQEWTDYLYFRDNPKGAAHTERWFHRAGCHHWFAVEPRHRHPRHQRSAYPPRLAEKS